MVERVYIVKREAFADQARHLCQEFADLLGIQGIRHLRIFNRYDFEGLSAEELRILTDEVLAEATLDEVYPEDFDFSDFSWVLPIEALPGQYDARADAAAQCAQIRFIGERPLCKTAQLYAFQGDLSADERKALAAWLINPIECREADLAKPERLQEDLAEPAAIAVVEGFREADMAGLQQYHADWSLAMTVADLTMIRDYFRDSEQRDPLMTEIRVLDTYWSDHCRHTTFHTELTLLDADGRSADNAAEASQRMALNNAIADLQAECQRRGKDYHLYPMALATLAPKLLKRAGKLDDLDESEEINACAIRRQVQTEEGKRDVVVLFKNETHNHPTEIEPYGGAATCLGGAIRDPLSGRGYVYQAMRVSGAANPLEPLAATRQGKLPQRKICQGAAKGYSSYGNQIGLATGQVREYYHPGYKAKRLECGAVLAAVPQEQLRRERPAPGDLVLLIGGRTGRDGVGGATGSSKTHTSESLSTSGAEVQKGNPTTERKLQRLFKRPEFSLLIKRCNDFGAGGVAVAVGELADGLTINLDAVPLKYRGLNGTEIAISESQERMAVVIEANKLDEIRSYIEAENLEFSCIAEVTAEPRLKMHWRGQTIVDLARSFLDLNGAKQSAEALLPAIDESALAAFFTDRAEGRTGAELLLAGLQRLNSASQKGLMQMFDSSIGTTTILAPYGGRFEDSPEEGIAALLPLPGAQTATLMSHAYDPHLAELSPYHGAYYAIMVALSRLVALGAKLPEARLSLQEYFERMSNEQAWGKLLAALAGAHRAQMDFGTAAIGGKDSMSGNFEELKVPPALIAFAVSTTAAEQVRSACLRPEQHYLYRSRSVLRADYLPDVQHYLTVMEKRAAALAAHADWSAMALGYSSHLERAVVATLGNRLGLHFLLPETELVRRAPGALMLATPEALTPERCAELDVELLAEITPDGNFTWEQTSVSGREVLRAYQSTLAELYPLTTPTDAYLPQATPEVPATLPAATYVRPSLKAAQRLARPSVLIPIFPGSNCEFDLARAFEKAGATVQFHLLQNQSAEQLAKSLDDLAKALGRQQILALPGGFSAGDEPEGSAKFIVAVLRNPRVRAAVESLLQQQDGLILGICNGFQALIKSGLLPWGEFREQDPDFGANLTYNRLGSHIARYVDCEVLTNRSPWLAALPVGARWSIPISHGEGRFVASEDLLRQLFEKDQVAFRYVPRSAEEAEALWNPNASMAAVEGIISPDGRVLGKMGHSERCGRYIALNIPGEHEQALFRSAVDYYKI